MKWVDSVPHLSVKAGSCYPVGALIRAPLTLALGKAPRAPLGFSLYFSGFPEVLEMNVYDWSFR